MSLRDPEVRSRVQHAIDLKEQGDLHGAIAVLLELDAERPRVGAVCGLLGHLFWNLDRPADAVIWFGRATRKSPKSEQASLGLFHTLRQVGRLKESVAEMRRFTALAKSADYDGMAEELRSRGEIDR